MLLEPLVDEFLRYIEAEKNYSPLTVKAYGYDLYGWLKYLDNEQSVADLESVKTLHVRGVMAHLHTSGIKAVTISRRLNAIRSFWNYLVDSEYTDYNPCRRVAPPKTPQRLPVYLSTDEVSALLDATDKNHYLDLAYRDRAVLSVFIYTGILDGQNYSHCG